jgi:hypothetical protein
MQKQVVEYAGVPVGVLIPFADSLRFKFHVMALDGRSFRSMRDAQSAIGAHMRNATSLFL